MEVLSSLLLDIPTIGTMDASSDIDEFNLSRLCFSAMFRWIRWLWPANVALWWPPPWWLEPEGPADAAKETIVEKFALLGTTASNSDSY